MRKIWDAIKAALGKGWRAAMCRVGRHRDSLLRLELSPATGGWDWAVYECLGCSRLRSGYRRLG